VRQVYDLPLAAYQVSGEFSMIKAAAANGWIDECRVTIEMLTAIRRAGADMIITYFARDVAQWLK
jgi:porphobilinogen synthase